MRLLILFLLFTLAAHALEDGERERLNEELPRAVQELENVHERLAGALQRREIALPDTMTAMLAARRAQEADWKRRLADPAAMIEADDADHFREQIEALSGRMEEVLGVIEETEASAGRWANCADTPELKRYQTFMRARIERGVGEIASGVEVQPGDDSDARQQHRHEALLHTMDIAHEGDGGVVPVDAPILREFHDQRRALRVLAERGLAQPSLQDSQELDRGMAILNLFSELMALAQTREEHLAGRDLAGSPVLIKAVAGCLGGEEQSLRALIAHQQEPRADEDVWNRIDGDLRAERDRRARFTTIVWEWFDLVNSLAELRQNLDQQLAEAPPAVRTETIARWNALDGERTVSETALGKALQERSRVAAIQAKGEITIQRRSYDELMEDLDLRLNQESEEREWRTRAKDPGIAAALVRLDAAKAALLKARGEQRMRERSAAQAQLDRELAEVAAEEAWSTAERGRTESEHLREALEQRRQQVRDALENPEPKPDGDTKF